jgi:hypothetical protein
LKLHDQPANVPIFLTPVEPDHYTVRFALDDRAAQIFDGRQVLVLAPSATYGIITRQDSRTLARLKTFFPDIRIVETIYDYLGQPYAVIAHVEGAPRLAPQTRVNARLGNVAELIGYDLARAEDSIALTMYWRSLANTPDNFTVFTQLIGATDPPVAAQDDSEPGRGSYPTLRWRAGEIIVDEYRLAFPRGDFELHVGMYNLETGARLPVSNANGAQMESDSVLLGKLSKP